MDWTISSKEKVNELFLFWLSTEEAQAHIKECISTIKHGTPKDLKAKVLSILSPSIQPPLFSPVRSAKLKSPRRDDIPSSPTLHGAEIEPEDNSSVVLSISKYNKDNEGVGIQDLLAMSLARRKSPIETSIEFSFIDGVFDNVDSSHISGEMTISRQDLGRILKRHMQTHPEASLISLKDILVPRFKPPTLHLELTEPPLCDLSGQVFRKRKGRYSAANSEFDHAILLKECGVNQPQIRHPGIVEEQTICRDVRDSMPIFSDLLIRSVCGLPRFLAAPLFKFIKRQYDGEEAVYSTVDNPPISSSSKPSTVGSISRNTFLEFYHDHIEGRDGHERLFRCLLLTSSTDVYSHRSLKVERAVIHEILLKRQKQDRRAYKEHNGKEEEDDPSLDPTKSEEEEDEIYVSESAVTNELIRRHISNIPPLTTPSSVSYKSSFQGCLQSNQEVGFSRYFLLPEDFKPMFKEILQHPGLTFLKDSPEFQTKYLETVMVRILHDHCCLDSDAISLRQVRCGDLLDTLRLLDCEEDVNRVLKYFSYEHFYVIYCQFWQLDKDHDMKLTKKDLCEYQSFKISKLVVDLIFKEIPRKLKGCPSPQTDSSSSAKDEERPSATDEKIMGYEDFVFFLLCEEDKDTWTSLRYFFRILDLDGDGYFDLTSDFNFFYQSVQERIEDFADPIRFDDVRSQLSDMMFPYGQARTKVTIQDIQKSRMASLFMNFLTNGEKFLSSDHEDPYLKHYDSHAIERTGWDRFARLKYDDLANNDESGGYVDDGDEY
ncbi:hypothetical protein ADUPG1_000134 [Aduncisulcus paluster]|uniref:PP2A regulatory subunit B'' EF-hand domain-containing protein n=1 Tax=Aduncisulcus paluster TaxID=2918883 RepID=A0ABQ5K555_9EUKA|nr:hypothetical protein ADUPG1_000134 [Aduncisulcus paluster]|eukprot:gnl/Carplike_NY0171/2696_a3622_623.p1 GENE.gnl/Carplike_NY0171/2696_a3622_623~~gnl/Carplike_NY0171/2696_a3622_623.p1  ORF type:complete len:771 (-),score=157.91 gnl/Carplike_NY0171/2696_a3622_623:133-2445(-)